MSRRAFQIFLVVLLAAFALGEAAFGQVPTPGGVAAARGRRAVPDRVTRGSLLLAAGDGWSEAPLVATEVDLRVRGVVARAEVRQRFTNPTGRWVEGVYVFPLPDRAAVDGLEVRAGDRVIVGKIAERAEARASYDAARREGRRAALLDEERPNLFTTSLANLGPGETVEVVLRYQEELRWDSGSFRLRFPLVVAPRYESPVAEPVIALAGAERSVLSTTPTPSDGDSGGAAFAGLPVAPPVVTADVAAARLRRLSGEESGGGDVPQPVRVRVELEPGFALQRLASRSHLLRTAREEGGRWQVELEGPVPADRDFALEWEPTAAAAPRSSLLLQPAPGGGSFALLLVLPPTGEAPPPERRLSRETIYVLDTSGSMAGESFARAREALLYALRRLDPGDRFNVVAFADRARQLFPHSAPADLESLEEASRWIEGLTADGGTEMLPALSLALAGEPDRGFLRQVVFLTDGSVAGERQLLDFLAGAMGESRLFTVAIGSAPNSWFLRKAAEIGRGTFTHVAAPRDVAERMAELYRKLESPVARDLELLWDDAGADAWPRRLPDLYAGEPLVVAAWLPRGGGVTVRAAIDDGRYETRLEPQSLEAGNRLAAGHRMAGTGGLDKLWARRQIEALEDTLFAGVPEAEVRRQVVALGLEHGLVSRWTSLVAVDATPVAPAGEPAERRVVPVLLPDGWQPGIAFGRLPQTGTPAPLLAMLGGLLVLVAWAVGRLP